VILVASIALKRMMDAVNYTMGLCAIVV
jgi:hypothetical protein